MAKLSDLPRIIKSAIEREVILEAGAKAIKRAIPARTRAGEGVRENLGPKHKLPNLKATTIKRRNILKSEGKLTGPGATPEKSGFNRSGDTLNNLKVETSNRKVEISLDAEGQSKLNDALQINKDYQFMRLSKDEFERFIKAVANKLGDAIRKINITDL